MSRPRTSEELILIARPPPGPRPKGLFSAAAARPAELEIKRVAEANGCRFRPLFSSRRNKVLRVVRPSGGGDLLDGFYCVHGPGPELRETARRLRKGPNFWAAYVRPGAEPTAREGPGEGEPDAQPSPTPDFSSLQRHLEPPPGVNATEAWKTPGAYGDGVSIVDLEWGWRFEHEDLVGLRGGVVVGPSERGPGNDHHGTAVLGVLGGRHDNGRGVKGIVPNARIEAIALQDDRDRPNDVTLPLAEAIRMAAERLAPGDILLLEVQHPGPRHDFTRREDQLGYIAPEWWPDIFAAVRYATAIGVIVVETAGNGAEDLDDPIYDRPDEGFPSWWTNPFKGANSSGALLVAAATPDNQVRMGYSNFGSRIDAQSWGDSIFTTGYGRFVNEGRNRTYTHRFGGTSGAAASGVGEITAVQGVLRHQGKIPLGPAEVARLLRSSGLAPPPGSRIGNRPVITELIERALRR
jgi:Subtilase family